MSYLGQMQNLDWASPSRIFATTQELLDSQPNYEHEVAIALDTRIKYQGTAPVIGGWRYATGAPLLGFLLFLPVNDGFTKLLLEFDGIEGSTTYVDTNASKMPRTWTQRSGLGHITNVGRNSTVARCFSMEKRSQRLMRGLTSLETPILRSEDGFSVIFPVGVRRTLVAKTDEAVTDYVF